MMKTACTQNKMNEKFDHLMNGNLGSWRENKGCTRENENGSNVIVQK